MIKQQKLPMGRKGYNVIYKSINKGRGVREITPNKEISAKVNIKPGGKQEKLGLKLMTTKR